MNLGVTLTFDFFGRAVCCNESAIQQGACLEDQVELHELGVHGCQNLLPSTVHFKQVTKSKVRALAEHSEEPRIKVSNRLVQAMYCKDSSMAGLE